MFNVSDCSARFLSKDKALLMTGSCSADISLCGEEHVLQGRQRQKAWRSRARIELFSLFFLWFGVSEFVCVFF